MGIPAPLSLHDDEVGSESPLCSSSTDVYRKRTASCCSLAANRCLRVRTSPRNRSNGVHYERQAHRWKAYVANHQGYCSVINEADREKRPSIVWVTGHFRRWSVSASAKPQPADRRSTTTHECMKSISSYRICVLSCDG